MRAFVCLGLGLALLTAAPALGATLSFDDQVLAELNRVRADPKELAAELRTEDEQYGPYDRISNRDPYAVDEAIDFLERQPPLPPLAADKRLASAASEFVKAQGPTGAVGHGAFGERLHQRGVWAGMSGETISYGQDTPLEVVRQLVLDIGVTDRGHRSLVFGRGYSAAGVACGRHAEYGSMCVIDFAGAFPR